MTIKSVTSYCSDLLQGAQFKNLPYHNFDHTQEVIDSVLIISNALGISKKEVEVMVIAACFHDTGFSETYHGHEEVSKRLAYDYLSKAKYKEDKIDSICACISATKLPQKPQDIFEAVLCDADMFHLGSTHFFYRNLLLRKEWELCCNLKMSNEEWEMNTIKFLENHSFKTSYGKTILEQGKQENLTKLKQLIRLK